jgi:ketosteroid isomerase-like protein
MKRQEQEGHSAIKCPVAGELSEDAVVVRAVYRAIGEGDASALARLVDPGVVWVHPLVARLPFDGTSCGLAAVLAGGFRRRDGSGPPFAAESFLEFGDGVLVVGRFFGGNGAGGERPFLHECFVRGGKIVTIREYPAGTL